LGRQRRWRPEPAQDRHRDVDPSGRDQYLHRHRHGDRRHAEHQRGTPGSARPGPPRRHDRLNGGSLRGRRVHHQRQPRIALGPTSGSGSGTFDITTTGTDTYNGIIADNPAAAAPDQDQRGANRWPWACEPTRPTHGQCWLPQVQHGRLDRRDGRASVTVASGGTAAAGYPDRPGPSGGSTRPRPGVVALAPIAPTT